jgi:beta-galactosidase
LLRSDGTVADEVTDNFGFRTIEFGPDFGFRLNGRKVLLKGCAGHHTLGALGAAAYPKAIEKRIRLLKAFGVNHIRTSHNPYSRDFIRQCDQLGILVVDELYDRWTQQHTGGRILFEQHWQQEVPEWVKRDRNSPSVILWSLGNELQQEINMPFNDFGITMYRLQKTLLQRYDTTRLVTVAMHPRYRNWKNDSLPADLALETDIQSYNYRYKYFPLDGKRYPWMTFYQSEAAIAGMPQNYYDMDLSRVVGLAYWGAVDYLGESMGWPAKGWSQGVFDITLEPRPKAYLMKSIFKPEEPLVHIAVVEKKQQVVTYTNADEVELMLNGKSLGRQTNPKFDPARRNQILWDSIAVADDCLEAVAYDAGRAVARHKIEAPGKAVRLRVTPEDDNWQADGTDLMHLRIEAVDSKDRRVAVADDEIHFSVEGDASLVAVGSGDMKSNEPNVASQRRLWQGSAQVILRSGRTPSKVVLKTTAEAYKPVTTVLRTYL